MLHHMHILLEQASTYRWLDGMEDLVARLSKSGYEMHAVSNYPIWWQIIEDQLRLSRYMAWTFVSCTGPMEVGFLSRHLFLFYICWLA